MYTSRFRRVITPLPIIVGLLSVSSSVEAQYVTFSQAAAVATQNGPYSTVTPTAIAVDQAGNTYLTGAFYDTVTLGNITLDHTKGRIFVAKRDPAGRYLWVSQAGGGQWEAGHDVAVDAAGNVYVTGYFDNAPATFGSIRVLNQTGHNGFIAKLSPTGTWLWAVRGGGLTAAEPAALALDSQANVYVTGDYQYGPAYFGPFTLTNASTGNSDRDMFVVKLNTDGQWQWAVGIGGSGNEAGQDIAVDAAGKVHVMGNFTSPTLTFGYDRIANFGSCNMLVAELDAHGTPQWINNGGGNNWDNGSSLAVDRQGNTYVAGSFFSAVAHFGATDLYKTGLAEVFVGKLDPFGVWLWAKRAGGTGSDSMGGIAVDAQGDVYVTGAHQSAYFTAGLLGIPQIGELDTYVFKLNSTTGDCLWLTSGGGALDDVGRSIVLDRNGKVYVAGTFQQEADFGQAHLAATLPYSMGFVAHINSTSLPLAATGQAPASALAVVPNPSRGNARIIGLPGFHSVFLYNALGAMVWKANSAEVTSKQLTLPADLAPGVYWLRAAGQTTRVVIE
ncbi:NHL repeat-containing protein [Hymenobacter rigui]|uniref:T9SS C-terminal target domain-containing protein n=1 Tax=Hymenobacter rigui TaxID=334424 RepID=A0A3R9PZR5_9BACT|nr:hypothetical protein [Hymenobacter rigui]RSK49831.1 hypothetical protein EI291_04070 [Hymenobacter rigui]